MESNFAAPAIERTPAVRGFTSRARICAVGARVLDASASGSGRRLDPLRPSSESAAGFARDTCPRGAVGRVDPAQVVAQLDHLVGVLAPQRSSGLVLLPAGSNGRVTHRVAPRRLPLVDAGLCRRWGVLPAVAQPRQGEVASEPPAAVPNDRAPVLGAERHRADGQRDEQSAPCPPEAAPRGDDS